VVFSDHKPLETLRTKNEVDTKLGEMLFYLSQYDFKVIYHKGKENLEADALSRNPILMEFHNEDPIKISNFLQKEEITQDQSQLEESEKLNCENGMYYEMRHGRKKLRIGDKLADELIRRAHLEFGHPGVDKMIRALTSNYLIKDLTKKITKFTRQCPTCIRNKSRGKQKLGLMSRLGPAERPFQIMSIDTIGGFKGARSNKGYLHLLIDHFTRYENKNHSGKGENRHPSSRPIHRNKQ
jgi:hypothetical protein